MPKRKHRPDEGENQEQAPPTAKYKETPNGRWKPATFRRRVEGAVDLTDWKTGGVRTIANDRVELLQIGPRGGKNYIPAADTDWCP